MNTVDLTQQLDALTETVARKLREKGLTLSSAEACTGGLFAARLTDLAGSSRFFDRSIVTYSNQAKLDHLGVRPETLETYGAVSPETAREMAVGLARVSGSDVCISVTGIAGPNGGTEEKPVGTVFIAVVYEGRTHSFQAPTVNVDRSYNRNHSVLSMLEHLNQLLTTD
ncbi:MAG: CinA family protein [Ruminiclostridium sp.]|nr:CinA family protein [Ruminiclostridium sp.]MBQ9934115.1 CinA family protein [Ruminiclostridium sp.]